MRRSVPGAHPAPRTLDDARAARSAAPPPPPRGTGDEGTARSSASDASSESTRVLLRAAKDGDVKRVEHLLSAESAVGQVPLARALHTAVASGRQGVAEVLIAKLADVNARSPKGVCAVHVAAENGRWPSLELLLKAQADIWVRNGNSQTVAEVAAEFGHTLLLQELAKRRMDTRGPDDPHHPIRTAVDFGHTSVVELMAHLHGSEVVNLKVQEGGALVHLAALRGNIDVLGALLRHRADIEARSPNKGATPLIMATSSQKEAMAQVLLERLKADVDARDKEGNTALHWACRKAYTNGVRLLLANRADVSAQNDRQLRPVDVLPRGQHVELLAELTAVKGAQPPRPAEVVERIDKFEDLADRGIPKEGSALFGCKRGHGPFATGEDDTLPRICGLRPADLREIVVETQRDLEEG